MSVFVLIPMSTFYPPLPSGPIAASEDETGIIAWMNSKADHLNWDLLPYDLFLQRAKAFGEGITPGGTGNHVGLSALLHLGIRVGEGREQTALLAAAAINGLNRARLPEPKLREIEGRYGLLVRSVIELATYTASRDEDDARADLLEMDREPDVTRQLARALVIVRDFGLLSPYLMYEKDSLRSVGFTQETVRAAADFSWEMSPKNRPEWFSDFDILATQCFDWLQNLAE